MPRYRVELVKKTYYSVMVEEPTEDEAEARVYELLHQNRLDTADEDVSTELVEEIDGTQS